jgi:hypothetical protein
MDQNLNDEIATQRARLREEIMERECLLTALDALEKYLASGHAPHSMRLGNLVSALLPSRSAVKLKELPSSPPALAAPAALPPPPPVERYVHPELTDSQFSRHGNIAALVRWAVERMTSDFSLNDVDAMLKREGKPTSRPAISVVLTRLKRREEIEEIQPAAGPYPAVYRNPNPADEAQPDLTDQREGSSTGSGCERSVDEMARGSRQ